MQQATDLAVGVAMPAWRGPAHGETDELTDRFSGGQHEEVERDAGTEPWNLRRHIDFQKKKHDDGIVGSGLLIGDDHDCTLI